MKREFQEKPEASGWTVERIFYLNLFGWFVSGSVLHSTGPAVTSPDSKISSLPHSPVSSASWSKVRSPST